MESNERDEDVVAREEEAAARDAGAIGGPGPYDDSDVDPEERPLREAGEGEQEGFEESEELLRENAEHGQHTANLDGFSGEVESDRSGAEYGEADEIPQSDS
jgi:hypothetical protein